MRKTLLISLVASLFLAGCSKENPVQEGPANPGGGLEAVFLGSWQIARPGGDGVIVNVPRVSCDNPVVITAIETDVIASKSPKSETVTRFELMEFEDRITWMPAVGNTSIAEQKNDDLFWLYAVNPMGKADWDNPMAYTRCKKPHE